jgi:hypothetical protein
MGTAPNSTSFGGTPSGYSYTRYVNTPGIKGWLNLTLLCGWEQKVCWWSESEKGNWNEAAFDSTVTSISDPVGEESGSTRKVVNLTFANLISLATSQRGNQVVSDPNYLNSMPRVRELQCRLYAKKNITSVIGVLSPCDIKSEIWAPPALQANK